MKEQMRIELHNETEYTERISFQDIWTHASRLKYAGCRVAAITDRNSVDGIHMAEHDFMRRGIQPIYGVTLSCIDVDDRYDVVLLAANLTGRDNIFRLIELLESNRFSFGRAVTREQLDAHRKGILLGAAAKNGQIVRAILHRRDQRYLETITQDYDYLEFTSEPYDIAATVVQLAAQGNLPLCAVQYAAGEIRLPDTLPLLLAGGRCTVFQNDRGAARGNERSVCPARGKAGRSKGLVR